MSRPAKWVAPVCIVLAGWTSGAAAAEKAALKPPFEEIGIDQKVGEQVPLDLILKDETGNPVRLGDLFRGKPVVLSLAYYRCPMLCTLVLNGLASSMGVMGLAPGRDYTAVTVSIDPRETPAMAAAAREGYVARTGLRDAAGGWRFLTGDAASIEWLAASVGFRYAFDEKSDQFAHASGVMILTPEGRLSRYLLGIEFAPKDLRLALVEASAGKIGSVRDRLLLLCFKYDPATGRYGAVAYTLVRAGGVLTVACLAVFLVIMLRRDARRARRDSAGPGVAAGRRA